MVVEPARSLPTERVTIVVLAIVLSFVALVSVYAHLDRSQDSACIREWATASSEDVTGRLSPNFVCVSDLAVGPRDPEEVASEPQTERLGGTAKASTVRALLVAWIGWTAIAIASLAAALVVAGGVAFEIRRLGFLQLKVDLKLLRRHCCVEGSARSPARVSE